MIGQPGFDCSNSLAKKFLPLERLEHANAQPLSVQPLPNYLAKALLKNNFTVEV
jgi:hypothetical protein